MIFQGKLYRGILLTGSGSCGHADTGEINFRTGIVQLGTAQLALLLLEYLLFFLEPDMVTHFNTIEAYIAVHDPQ